MKVVLANYIKLSKGKHLEILDLRNKDYIRKTMRNQEPICEASHFSWLDELKNSSSQEYFAIFFNDVIQGTLSWNKDEKGEIYWGIYCKKDVHPLISSLSAYAFFEYLFKNMKFEKIDSYVRVENVLAYSFNKHLGFEDCYKDEEFYYLFMDSKMWQKNKSVGFAKSINRYFDKIEFEFL